MLAPWLLFTVRFLPLLLPTFTTLVAANCYLRNGTDINISWGNSDRYASCNPDGPGASMCCSINGGGDSCAPVYANNPSLALCNNQGGNLLWRESCTDQDWLSVNCVKLFMNVSDKDVTLTNCSAYNLGGGFCYGTANVGCCAAGHAVFVDPTSGEQVSVNPALSSSSFSTGSSTSTSTSTSTSVSTTSPTSTPATSEGISSGAKAGIGIGVSLGVVAVALIAVIALRRRKRNHEYRPDTMTQPESFAPAKSELKGGTGRPMAFELGSPGREPYRSIKTNHDGSEPVELNA